MEWVSRHNGEQVDLYDADNRFIGCCRRIPKIGWLAIDCRDGNPSLWRKLYLAAALKDAKAALEKVMLPAAVWGGE